MTPVLSGTLPGPVFLTLYPLRSGCGLKDGAGTTVLPLRRPRLGWQACSPTHPFPVSLALVPWWGNHLGEDNYNETKWRRPKQFKSVQGSLLKRLIPMGVQIAQDNCESWRPEKNYTKLLNKFVLKNFSECRNCQSWWHEAPNKEDLWLKKREKWAACPPAEGR